MQVNCLCGEKRGDTLAEMKSRTHQISVFDNFIFLLAFFFSINSWTANGVWEQEVLPWLSGYPLLG